MIKINATELLDETMDAMRTSGEYLAICKRTHPFGLYLGGNTKYSEARAHIQWQKYEMKLVTLQWIAKRYNIVAATRVYRDWYERTKWQRIMPEADAERILECFKDERYR